MHNLADEAKLDTITPEEIMVLLYINGTNDRELQDKFLKEYEPTLETMKKIALRTTRNCKQLEANTDTIENHGSSAKCKQ